MIKFNYVVATFLLLSVTTVFAQDTTTAVMSAPATHEAPAAPEASVLSEASDVAVDANTQIKIVEVAPEITAAIGSPEPGKALVVFFRPSAFVGSMIGFKVREGDVELGKLRNGNYFTLQVEPGKHSYVVHSEAKDETTLELEEGETYFLAGEINMGIMAGRPNLSPSDIIAFSAAFKKLKPSKPLE